jgi:FixJ family two-component response regulator
MRRWPSVPVLLISGQATVPLAVEAVRQGLMGVIEKTARPEEFLADIKSAIATAQTPEWQFRTSMASARVKLEKLTSRELSVLKLIALGLTNRSIARRLALGLRTIEKCRASLLEHLGVSCSATAVRLLACAEAAATLPAAFSGVAPAAYNHSSFGSDTCV